ncbi:MAG: hypothetical protein U0836_15475 [Pirellulales bacterium]
MSLENSPRSRSGKIRYGLAAWLLGLPLPIILLALIWRGCDW